MFRRLIKGHRVYICVADNKGMEWISNALQVPEIYVPIGCNKKPSRKVFLKDKKLKIYRLGKFCSYATPRFYTLYKKNTHKIIGFITDFGWDFTDDTTREIDISILKKEDRGFSIILDIIMITIQFIYMNKIAKRLRFRIPSKHDEKPPLYAQHLGGRLLGLSNEEHPISHQPIKRYIYEFSKQDWYQLLDKVKWDPQIDYGFTHLSLWKLCRK